MDVNEIVSEAKGILSESHVVDLVLRATEFLRIYAGEKNTFYQSAKSIKAFVDEHPHLYYPVERADQEYKERAKAIVKHSMEGFVHFLERGLAGGLSINRQAQIDVVSDYLEQAQAMLEDDKMHPAAPAVLIGASLEEFLRNWAEEQDLIGAVKNPGLDAYAGKLKQTNLINKQDAKDITSWGGLRNAAAHGEFDQIQKEAIGLMLQGVNLFMRKYAERS